MPLKIAVQTIDGKKLEEFAPPNAELNRLLPIGNPAFPLLRYIDPYGNTFFNGFQMDGLLQELDHIVANATTSEDSEFLSRVRGMAERCKTTPHLFLRFIGD
jgi:hypothetical protein